VRITGLKATPVNIPLEAPMWWTGGLYPGTSKVVVEILTDQGLVGLGEAPSADLLGPIHAMGERLVGQDPLDIAACEERCVPPWQIVQNTDDPSAVKAFGAIEIGLWDLRGKAWDQPLYQRVEEIRLQSSGSGMRATTSIAVSVPAATVRTTSTAASAVVRASRRAEAPARNSRGVPAPTSRRMTRPRL